MKKKSLAAKKTIHRSLFNYLKYSRVNKVFNGYRNHLDKFINKKNKIGVAISGGPDSLALAYLTKCYLLIKRSKKKKKKANVKHNLLAFALVFCLFKLILQKVLKALFY